MAESMIIFPRQSSRLDGSLNQKVMAFLNKLATDDAAAGLHIERIHNAADPRARTGRVDLSYRALLFKLTGEKTAYVLHGVYPHDEAYEVAAKTRLSVNPVNGITDFVTADPAQPPRYEAPAQASVADGPRPLIDFRAEDLIVSLGIPPEVARTAVRLTTPETVRDYACTLPEWQGLALVMLAGGESITSVGEELKIFKADEAPAASQSVGPSSSAATAEAARSCRGSHRRSGTKRVRSGVRKYRFVATKLVDRLPAGSSTPEGRSTIRHWPRPSVARE